MARLVILSMFAGWFATGLHAHEVQPTVGDLTVEQGEARLVLRINLDAFLAGIDLDAVDDTNDARNAGDYDSLRALEADEIASRAPDLLEGWNALPMLVVDGTPVTLRSFLVEMPPEDGQETARVAQWTLSGMVPAGAKNAVFNWPGGGGPMVLRQQGVAEPYTGYLTGGEASEPIALAGGGEQGGWAVFASYIPVGFDHILPQGLDHILFVLGLFFLSTQLGPLLWQVSAFTLAHTVTLALGALGLVSIPGSIVEPLIAASIVFVAVENIFVSGLSRWRPLIVFGFGLLHGLGFASVLGEFGLPEGQFIPALIGFNIGVEFGQLTVIAMAAVLIAISVQVARLAPLNGLEEEVREHSVMFRAVSVTGSLIIAIIGAWWVVERVFL